MGAWIEMSENDALRSQISSRTPRWVRGLKSGPHFLDIKTMQSHPTMGAWIEIAPLGVNILDNALSHPTMGAWIEIRLPYVLPYHAWPSHPTMGAWIEIHLIIFFFLH